LNACRVRAPAREEEVVGYCPLPLPLPLPLPHADLEERANFGAGVSPAGS